MKPCLPPLFSVFVMATLLVACSKQRPQSASSVQAPTPTTSETTSIASTPTSTIPLVTSVAKGTSEEEVLSMLGKPEYVMEANKRRVMKYKTVQVTLVDGFVVDSNSMLFTSKPTTSLRPRPAAPAAVYQNTTDNSAGFESSARVQVESRVRQLVYTRYRAKRPSCSSNYNVHVQSDAMQAIAGWPDQYRITGSVTYTPSGTYDIVNQRFDAVVKKRENGGVEVLELDLKT